MDMPKILIADSSDEFRQALTEPLCGSYQVRACGTGTQALELLRSFRPDILLLDLVLPEIDGIRVLQQAADAGIHPAVITLSRLQSDYIQRALNRFGVEYMLLKPCDIQAIVGHISDLSAGIQPAAVSQTDPQSVVAAALLSLGFAAKLDGYRYLLDAIPLFIRDPHQAITKELYVTVGNLHHKDPKLVERSIRSAIETSWKKRNDSVWRTYFLPAPDGSVPRPSNGDFIAQLAEILAEQLLSKTGS